MSHNGSLNKEQLGELEQIFRVESLEHVKQLAGLLFRMEEEGVQEQWLADAFRQAHNLKGSAGLLGFERVARITHRLEDVIGVIKRGEQILTAPTMDLLLGALDVVREAVDSSKPGDDVLTPDENATLTSLQSWLESVSPAAVDKSAAQPPPEPDAHEPAAGAQEAPEAAQEPGSSRTSATEQDSFIRVTAQSLNSLIAQVDDLFEAQVQVEGFGRELDQIRRGVEQLTRAVRKLRTEAPSSEAEEAEDLADLLHVRLDAAAGSFDRNMQGLSRRIGKAQQEVGRMGLATLDTLHVKLRQQVREVSRFTGKDVELHFEGGEYAVDRRVLEALSEPLVHLVRNAVDHGIEPAEQRQAAGKPQAGQLAVRARHLGDAVELSLTDDGRGIDLDAVRRSLVAHGLTTEEVDELADEQLLDRLFDSGFSTRGQVSEVSGRGVGLDVVKHTMDRVGGEVRLESHAGQFTTIALRLPLSMSTVRSLLVSVGGRTLAIPAANADKVLILRPTDLTDLGKGEVVELGDAHVPTTSLHVLLGLPSPQWADDASRKAVVLRFGDRRWALYVDDVLEYTEVIVKPLGDLLERVDTVSGIALLADAELALMLNPGDLVRAAGRRTRSQGSSATTDSTPSQTQQVVLVVDDSIATRALERSLLESAGYRVLTATDGYNALEVLASRHCDLVITDAQMPHMNGFELTRTLKSRAPLAHLPVIMITSLGSPEDIELGMASGADAYVVKKNLTQHELVTTINQLL